MLRSLAIVLVTAGLPGALYAQRPVKPTNLAALNTKEDEDDPHVSQDGLRLFYAAKDARRWTLMLAQRKKGALTWPKGEPLDGPDADTDNRAPFFTGDNHDLYFATRIQVRAPEAGAKIDTNWDLVHSIKLVGATQFTAPTPIQSACTEADESSPWLTATNLELYFSRKTKEGWRIFLARRKTAREPFGEPDLVEEIPAGFQHASLSRSGLQMYLHGPLDKNRWGLFRAKRSGPREPWGPPQELANLNSAAAPVGDMSPCLSRDGSKLYFSSDRPGGKGGRDLWMIDTVFLP